MSLNLSGALSKEQRDALPASDFAVPGKRALPMHDETHVRMAWNMVDKTKGLTPEERSTAKSKIVNRAHKLGINTDDWNIKAEDGEEDPRVDDHDEDDQLEPNEVKANSATIQFSGMALDFPEDKDHPNKVPFQGVLTRIDEPSDNPLSGSNGKRVVLPKDVAEKALGSLLGMAIDFTKELDGHDVKSKIGFITEANIKGNAIHIGGYFYGADFPDEVKHIQAEKSSLGFSYEAQAKVRSMNDDPLVVKSCVFTGAAVLYKNKAAYTSTSLSANMEKEKMNNDEKFLKMIEDLQNKIAKLEASNAEKDKEASKLAAGSIQHIIKPHADSLRQCAASMAAAGIGMHPKYGHVAALHHMADNMEAEAALGKTPHIYQTSDFLHAGADKSESSKEFADLKAGMDAINSKLVDLEKAKFEAAASPERKTLSPSIISLLAKSGIKTAEGEKMSISDVDSLLANTKIKTSDRIAIKMALKNAGNL